MSDAPRYQPPALEARWQQRWDSAGQHRTPAELDGSCGESYYALSMFP